MTKVDQKIGFLGAGAMAQAVAEGLVSSGTVDASNIIASATSDRFKSWWDQKNIKFTTDNSLLVSESSVVFVAVKPHLYTGAINALAAKGANYTDSKLFVSIMAGVTVKDLQEALKAITPCARVVRTMPNTPVKVRKGSMSVTFSEECTDDDKDLVITLCSSVGKCDEIPERLQNAFAAMAGAGPAYIYQVIEALADGGVRMGLPRAMAMEHAAAMVEGSGAMVLQAGKHPAQLKDEVCSPGGSTIRGVQKLEEGGVRAAFISAVQAAAERNEELGKK